MEDPTVTRRADWQNMITSRFQGQYIHRCESLGVFTRFKTPVNERVPNHRRPLLLYDGFQMRCFSGSDCTIKQSFEMGRRSNRRKKNKEASLPPVPYMYRPVREFLHYWDQTIAQRKKRRPENIKPAKPKERWGLVEQPNPLKVLRVRSMFRNCYFSILLVGQAYEASEIPTIHDPITIRRPGEVVDIKTAVRNYWSFPLIGFNSILEVPVYSFELMNHQSQRELQVMGKYAKLKKKDFYFY